MALADFKASLNLSDDDDLRGKLGVADYPALVEYEITQQDLDQIGQAPADWIEASKVTAMACESLSEVLSEKFHVSEDYLHRLNPEIQDWNSTNVVAVRIRVPNVLSGERLAAAAKIVVDCARYRMRALDGGGRIIASFPCSVAREGKAAPTGELHVATLAPAPNYTFDPKNYPESPRAQKVGGKLIIPPGPNNPVGVYWLGLNLPGFGIHGTPHPETIGRRESHGCFRLTNWDIIRLASMVTYSTPVEVTGF
jgi:lipoprotein-anchoring transpeptidase ErfK/SrfK